MSEFKALRKERRKKEKTKIRKEKIFTNNSFFGSFFVLLLIYSIYNSWPDIPKTLIMLILTMLIHVVESGQYINILTHYEQLSKFQYKSASAKNKMNSLIRYCSKCITLIGIMAEKIWETCKFRSDINSQLQLLHGGVDIKNRFKKYSSLAVTS